MISMFLKRIRQLLAWKRSVNLTTQGPSWGYLKVIFSETLSTFGDKRLRNGSKNGLRAPRTGMGCPHIGVCVARAGLESSSWGTKKLIAWLLQILKISRVPPRRTFIYPVCVKRLTPRRRCIGPSRNDLAYRGTSPMRKRTPIGLHRRPMPRVLGGS